MTQQNNQIQIPEGITLGNKVAIIPSVSLDFCHSGKFSSLAKPYTWVNRWMPLGQYEIHVDNVDIPFLRVFFGSKLMTAVIPSPVSGLLLTPLDFAIGSSLGTAHILLPDDEPLPEKGDSTFNHFGDLCWDYRKYFLRDSRYWTQGPWSEKELKNKIMRQYSSQVEIINALPKFKDNGILEHIRKVQPSLRPYIKHLA